MIPVGRNQCIFVKEETTFGTPNYPAGSDVVLVIADASFSQTKGFLEDEQRRPTLSKLSRIAGPYKPGEFTVQAYVKPSGALGTAPKVGTLLKLGFGVETINAGTSVVYSLAGIDDEILSATIVHQFGNTTFFNFGCVVDKMEFPVKAGDSQDAVGQVTFSGNFLRQKRAGISAVNNVGGYSATDTAITVDNGEEFQTEALIKFESEDNGGSGYEITDVTGNVVTISPGLAGAIADDCVVSGFIPTPSDAGYIIHGRYGQCTEDDGGGSTNVVIMEATINIENNFKVIEEEKTNSDYPETCIKSQRNVTTNITKILKNGDAQLYTESENQTQRDITIPVGDTASKRYTFNMPIVEADTPSMSGTDEITLNRPGQALGSASYDDEITLTFD